MTPTIQVIVSFDLPKVNVQRMIWQPVTDKDGRKMRLAPLDWQPSGAHEALENLAQTVEAQGEEILRLRVALERVASHEAFLCATSDIDPELHARMKFAAAILDGGTVEGGVA